MKGKTIVRYTRDTLPRGRTSWYRLNKMSEDEIEEKSQDSDTPRWTTKMFKTATWRMPQKKVPVHMLLDQDIVDWFRSQGKGYQSRINSVLKSYVHHKDKHA
jgi:uncharacterized protein (DUF4415 family)